MRLRQWRPIGSYGTTSSSLPPEGARFATRFVGATVARRLKKGEKKRDDAVTSRKSAV
jgi:hypothetical protein